MLKLFITLSSSLSVVVLHYYFGPTKLFSDLCLVKFLDISVKISFYADWNILLVMIQQERIFANIISTI